MKALAAIAEVLLAGSAVAIAGPIGFMGLVIPHVVRFFVGVDYRWIMPYSALFEAILLVSADIAARLVLRPQELPAGVMTALVGGRSLSTSPAGGSSGDTDAEERQG